MDCCEACCVDGDDVAVVDWKDAEAPVSASEVAEGAVVAVEGSAVDLLETAAATVAGDAAVVTFRLEKPEGAVEVDGVDDTDACSSPVTTASAAAFVGIAAAAGASVADAA